MIKRLFYTSILALAFAGACAHYRFGNAGRALPGGYDRVAIPVFVNETNEVGIETYFTEDLRNEFERSRIAKVTSKDDAELIIEGRIYNLIFTPTILITSSSNQLLAPNPVPTPVPTPGPPSGATPNPNPLPANADLTKQYVVSVTVHLEAHKASDNSIIWQSDFTDSRQYDAPLLGTSTLNGVPGTSGQAGVYNESSRQDTLALIAKDLMAQAHDRITENF